LLLMTVLTIRETRGSKRKKKGAADSAKKRGKRE